MHYLELNREPEKFKKSVLDWMSYRYPYFPIGISNTEYYMSNFINKYKESKILVVGGGPTTNTVRWSHLDYDYIFSCNHFFLNDRLSQIPVDFVCTGPEVQHNNERFIDYVSRYSPTICVANHDIKDEEIKFLISQGLKVCLAEVRMKFKIGMGAPLLILAALFEPRQLDFVGIDGYPKDIKNGDDSLHSFEPNKIKTGKLDTYSKLFDHHKRLWDYLKTLKVQINNLGHGHPYNMFTDCV